MNDRTPTATSSDGRTASRGFSSLWADQSRRTWFGAALIPTLIAAVVTVLFVAMTYDRTGAVVAPAQVDALTLDAIDASRIYVPVATAAFSVWVTLVAFTALAGSDSAERTAILLRLRAVVQMTFAVGWAAATSLAVLIAVAGTDAWPVVGMVTVMVLLTAAFATLSALYLVVGNAGMRREQVQRIVSDERTRRDDLLRQSAHHPLWPRVLGWSIIVIVCDVLVASFAFSDVARPASVALRMIILAVFQLGVVCAVAYDAYLALRRPSSLGWFPRTGQRALTYGALPVAGCALATQLTQGWAVVAVAVAAVAVPIAAVQWPRWGLASGLCGLAARGLEMSVRRYSLHLDHME